MGPGEGRTRLWGSLASCAPVGNRRSRRVANPPDPEGTPSILPHKSLPRLPLLKDALEFPALLLVENLLDLDFAVAQHGAVILPEIAEDGLHLLLLGRCQVEFLLHSREIEFPAHGGIEGRLVQAIMHL